MNSELNNFFKKEQKRVVEPGPYFVQRVMTRLASGKPYLPSVWDLLPGAARPVLALALMVLFAVLAVQILMPVQPNRSAIEAYLQQDLSPQERLLVVDPQTNVGVSQFEEFIISPEPQQ